MGYIAKPSPWDPFLRLRWMIWNQWHHLNESERRALWIFIGALLLLFGCWIGFQLRQRHKSPPEGA
ncbi:MAG TPA: hypothetical protein VNM14_14355 [Planctomycetota bacterium]|jgi:hypothetical protein|nr:hypothetical protein [Planctomycetota bacterium]